jgi:hypothetical protein
LALAVKKEGKTIRLKLQKSPRKICHLNPRADDVESNKAVRLTLSLAVSAKHEWVTP